MTTSGRAADLFPPAELLCVCEQFHKVRHNIIWYNFGQEFLKSPHVFFFLSLSPSPSLPLHSHTLFLKSIFAESLPKMSCWFWGGKKKKNWQQRLSFPPPFSLFLISLYLSVVHSLCFSLCLSLTVLNSLSFSGAVEDSGRSEEKKKEGWRELTKLENVTEITIGQVSHLNCNIYVHSFNSERWQRFFWRCIRDGWAGVCVWLTPELAGEQWHSVNHRHQ